ncbi:MAG: hypothetical protein J5643_01150 [Lachnospiraceae bacterium]|nr:hypothetical protein [Lachnospiraceae bacterium]
MIKSKLQIRQESLIPYVAGLFAMVAAFMMFADCTVAAGGASKMAMDSSLQGESLEKFGWILQVFGAISMIVILFAMVKKSLMQLAIPIGLSALGLLFRTLADGKYWVALGIVILTGWCFVMSIDAGQSAFKTITIVLCVASLVLTILLCMPGANETITGISSRYRALFCYRTEAAGEGAAAVWNWNISYIVYIISYLSVMLLILFASTTQFVAETGEEKEEKKEKNEKSGDAAKSGDPFEAMKNLYKLNSGAEGQVKKDKEQKAPEKIVVEKTEPVTPESEVVSGKTAAQTVETEPVYTVPVSGSRLQKSLKEEIVYDRDQKLEHRNVVRSFSVIGMIVSFLMLVAGVLFFTNVIEIQYAQPSGILMIVFGIGLFCVFGNNLTYKEYYMKTIVTERKVVHEESNWEEVLANRLEEDERSIASLTETYARMTDMYAKLLASTAELSNSVKALGMRTTQELPGGDSETRTADVESASVTPDVDTDEETKRIEEELRAIEEEAERQRAEAERIAREQAERRRAEEERIAKEAAERLARENEERIAREAEERLAREEQERLAREEQERLAKEAEERLAREAEERIAKEAEERLAKEARERLAKEAEERLAREAEDDARKHLAEAFGDEFGADEVAKAYEAAMAEGLSSKEIADSFRKESAAYKQAEAAPVIEVPAEPVEEKVEEIAEAIEEPVTEVVEEVTEAAEEIPAALEETVEEATEAVEEIPEAVEEKIEEVAESIEEPAAEVIEEVTEAAEEIPAAFEEKAEEIAETIEEPAAEIVEEVTEAAEEVPAALEEKAEEIAETIEEPAAEIVEEVTEAVEEIPAAVEAAAEKAEEEIDDGVPELQPVADNAAILDQIGAGLYKPAYEEAPASNQDWFMGSRADDSSDRDSSPAFSFFGGLGLREDDSEKSSESAFGLNDEEPADENPVVEGAYPYFGNSIFGADNQEETSADQEAPVEDNPYGQEPVSTEREIIEDFVLPTFHGSGFESAEDSDEAQNLEDDFYKPGYKIKSFTKKNTSWLEDEEDDFGTPVGPGGISAPETALPMDEEPGVPMDDEPELPMDEEPELPMDEEPELPMDEEPDIPMDEEPELPAEEEAEKSEEEKPAEEAVEEKKEDTDRISRLQQKLAEIRKRNGEKYGGDIFIGDDDF